MRCMPGIPKNQARNLRSPVQYKARSPHLPDLKVAPPAHTWSAAISTMRKQLLPIRLPLKLHAHLGVPPDSGEPGAHRGEECAHLLA